jgi:iron(III) transport system ATP-binding protein
MVSVTLRNVTKRYGDVLAVDRATLEIREGEFFFLLGPSGCGKTTLLRMLAGFLDPDEGEVLFGTCRMNDTPAHRRNTGMVFQNYALWPHMNVFDNVAYGLELRDVERPELKRRVAEALEMVQLTGLEKRKPNELSGGQQQRVALARALVIRPDVLLFDEPLSNLDAKLRLEMRQELRRIHAQTGITSVYVTHDQKEALSLAHRVAVMRNGRVQQVDAPREIYARPATRFVAEFIGQANVLRGEATPSGEGSAVATPYGPLRSTSRAQGRVLCCIRPEALALCRPGAPAPANRIGGVVRDATYLGDQEQLSLRLASATGEAPEDVHLLLHHPTTPPPQTGESVEVAFAPEDVILVADES